MPAACVVHLLQCVPEKEALALDSFDLLWHCAWPVSIPHFFFVPPLRFDVAIKNLRFLYDAAFVKFDHVY